ncbi:MULTISPECIES: DUF664 domain-containing protein [unclassified Saccharopolyspora]|uniref:mycothiol transferase n=1 Tax=unclassified Saccharopolyspora TaxID=2646250 RepID=UPI001CD7A142|nr:MULTISPECIES: DUF664 domain-containing protein [unclassified Saccharopolyspora]MCA1187035.1 DinB family protein [Saccharopolyspora sp. 6T]MCA1224824.1 DinB family protein [Saccharopolyspora sp. 6M]MCA1280172.1 DinB family protein [Saccharopolyspora sp. 7B]
MTGTDERTDLLGLLGEQRHALLITVRGLSDAAAARRTTASDLTLGGLLKHLAAVEREWTRVLRSRPDPEQLGGADPDSLRMGPDDALADLIDDYRQAAEDTDRAVAELPDLGVPLPLPAAPWFPPGAEWTARRVVGHLLRETAQHGGHADLIREALDGASTTRQLAADFGIDRS